MKRLGLSAVLLSLALSVPAPAPAQSVSYKWFYEGCNEWSCHWASISNVQYSVSPFGYLSWWAWGTFSFHVFGEYLGLEPGDELGGLQGGAYFEPIGPFGLGFESYVFWPTGSETTVLEFDQPWMPGSHGWISMTYGPAGYADHEPYGEDIAEQFGDEIRVDLVRVAVPEPATGLLVLVGMASVALRRRRERST